ncbi:TRAP transporter small permease [Ottowia sp.]|uniref:TRAP transporter small permease n=1 Tax=Ottowia sp. TaxID=1898956 RepID=UPI0025E6E7E9|nr:TRAP transporter small permease [Ottowia sp.]MBK6614381.1 TRAP transporter small permease [Ottowia sp.]MBK6745064.1 TRAP transporter small permease [Ottowia sp.]
MPLPPQPTRRGATVADARPAPLRPAPAVAQPRVPLAIEDWLTVVIMALLALITFANVLVRYFTSASFAWTEEVSVFLMIVLAMVAGSAAVARNRHIRIEFFADGGTPRRQRALATFGAAMVALLFGLIAVLSVRLVWDDVQYGETSPGIGVPQWWYSIWLPIISAAITLRALGLMLRRGRAAGDDPKAPTSPEVRAEERAP